jgi:hypothetical protein
MRGEQHIAACGDVCAECPRFLATISGDPDQLASVAELWFRVGFRNRIVSNEEIQCTGCSKTKVCVHNITNCIHLAGKETCGECDFFPCQRMDSIFERSKRFNTLCAEKCSKDEYNQLCKAFFRKKQILQEIQRNKNR